MKEERYYRAMSVKEGNECEYKYRTAALSSTFCYTKKESEKRCFKGSITVRDSTCMTSANTFGHPSPIVPICYILAL